MDVARPLLARLESGLDSQTTVFGWDDQLSPATSRRRRGLPLSAAIENEATTTGWFRPPDSAVAHSQRRPFGGSVSADGLDRLEVPVGESVAPGSPVVRVPWNI